MLKQILTIGQLFLLTCISVGQVNPTPGLADEFKRIGATANSKLQHGEMFQGFTSSYVQGSQFFNPEWAGGYIITSANQVVRDSSFQYKFDKLRHELFISVKTDDGSEPIHVMAADKNQIRSFVLISDDTHVFEPGRNFGADSPQDFYEVLARKDSGFTLLKYVKSKFVKYDVSDLTRMKRGDVFDEYIDKISYYICFKTAKPQLVSFRERSVLNILPDSKKPIAEDYFLNNRDKEENDNFLILLVNALNK